MAKAPSTAPSVFAAYTPATLRPRPTDAQFQALFEPRGVLVTGASSGIGRAIALRFARQGAAVVGVARRTGKTKWAAKIATVGYLDHGHQGTWAASIKALRSSCDVILIGSTILMRKGSIMVFIGRLASLSAQSAPGS